MSGGNPKRLSNAKVLFAAIGAPVMTIGFWQTHSGVCIGITAFMTIVFWIVLYLRIREMVHTIRGN